MSNEDYRNGYKDGFKEGYEYGRKAAEPPSNPYNPYTTIPAQGWKPEQKCNVCGMSFVDELGRLKTMGLVCQHINCPSKITATVKPNTQAWSSWMSGRPSTNTQLTYSVNTVADGMSYEEIYGSVVYQQGRKST